MSLIKKNEYKYIVIIVFLLVLTIDYRLSLLGIGLIVIGVSIINPIIWIYIVLIYLTFETPILNLMPQNAISIIRYGIEGVSYFVMIKSFIFFQRKKMKLDYNKIDKYLTLFLIFSLIGASINLVKPTMYIMGIRWIIRYVVIYLIFKFNKFNKKQIQTLLDFLWKLIILQLILGAAHFIFREQLDIFLKPKIIDMGFHSIEITQLDSKFGIYSTFGRYGEYAYFLSIANIYIFSRYRKEKKRIQLYIFLIAMIILMLTYARQALLGVSTGIIVYILSDKSGGRILKRKVLALGIVGVFILGVYLSYGNFTVGKGILNEGIAQRYLSIFSLDFIKGDYEGQGRTYFLTTVNKKIMENKPLLGFGVGMYGTESAISYNQKVYDELNVPIKFSMDVYWTSILGQVGIIGVFYLFMVYYSVYKDSKKYEKNNDLLGKIAVFIKIMFWVIMIESFFGSNLSDRYQAFYIWMFLGIYDNLKYEFKSWELNKREYKIDKFEGKEKIK